MRRPDHREAILQAALRLSSTEGLDAIPTAEVCREAGVSNGTMFHYFPTKAALHSALYLRAMSGYQEAIVSALKTARSARSGIRGIVLAHARWVIAHAEEARFLHEGRRGHGAELLEQEIRAQNEDFLRTVSAWLEPHVKAEAIKRYPKSVLIALLFGPAHTLTRDWMRTGDARSLLEAAPILADAAWASLARAARGDESR